MLPINVWAPCQPTFQSSASTQSRIINPHFLANLLPSFCQFPTFMYVGQTQCSPIIIVICLFRLVKDNCSGLLDREMEELVWKPLLYAALTKSIEKFQLLHTDYSSIDLVDGNFRWVVSGVFKISCGLFYEDFPFDTQICPIWLVGYRWDKSIVRFSHQLSFMGFPQRSLAYRIEYQDSETIPEIFFDRPMAGFDIKLKRKLHPFFFNIFLPSYWITFASLISFMVPASIVPGEL